MLNTSPKRRLPLLTLALRAYLTGAGKRGMNTDAELLENLKRDFRLTDQECHALHVLAGCGRLEEFRRLEVEQQDPTT